MPQQNTPFFTNLFTAILKTSLAFFSFLPFFGWGVVVVVLFVVVVVVVLCFVVV